MLSIMMEDYRETSPQSMMIHSDKINAMSTTEKLERYRKLLLKEEEIRERLERVIEDSNGDAVGRIPRVLMQRRAHGEAANPQRRKMSCPAIRVEQEIDSSRGYPHIQPPGSPNMTRRSSMVPDIRVQPVHSPQLSTPSTKRSPNSDLLEPRSRNTRRRKLSCPVGMNMPRYSSSEDLRENELGSPRLAPRRMSMQPSFAEIRAIQAKEKLERRRASLKSLEEDVLKAQNVLAVAKALSMTSLAEDQTETDEDKDEDLRKRSSCAL